jgi:AcrR family transcriptional regulator
VARAPKTRSTGQHHGDLRRALVDTARQMVDDGETDFSLRELARRAGVTPAAPYHHFADKDAVLDEIGKAGFEGLLRELDEAEGATDDPAAQLVSMVGAYLRFSVTHQAHYKLMFPASLGRAGHHDELRATAEHAFGRLVAAVGRARPDADPEERGFLALSVWAMSHGFVTLERDGLLEGAPGAQRFEQLAARVGKLAVILVRSPDATA